MAEQQVQITDLDPQQLQEVKKQLDEELDHLTNSFGQLKQAQAKFRSCMSDIDELTPATTDKEVLIPLTSSLYVPGNLGDVSNVIVDVGTGYYVKKTRAEANSHYKTKADFVQQNLDTLQKTIERKQENAQSVVQVMQMKLQEQQQQPQKA
ncbi:subunit of tubulin prefoldin [Apiotrichum porosum]|uniref:Subunit of tubulin prefoldin n=1 Tax=Apiotrichum porosum TaxID=105984 RepID=A0A427XJX5_9TREE|nr:subunit of tubulin prefoldin [Apiotrichum porosum]RSH79057.1 subunit of tubulin prefoldin [Apiotrichum porosum]